MTLDEWLAIPEDRRVEFIDGQLIDRGRPGPQHGRAQGKAFALIDGPFGRRVGGGGRPGGWWISLEVDLEIVGLGCRPDILGWRRDRHPRLPEPDARGLVTAVPDWICEVLSPRTASVDQGRKRRAYHEAGVEHYWMIDPTNGTLTVPSGVVLSRARRGATLGVMSLAEMLPNIQALSRGDKLRLVQILAQELAAEEDGASLAAGLAYPVWSPDQAFEAAETLLQALRTEDGRPA